MTQGFAGPPLGGGGPFAPIIVDTDPGAVGAGRLWLTAAGILYVRNAANTAWIALGAPSATPDLAAVLGAGNDPGGSPIVGASAAGANGASLAVNAAPGTGVGGDANLGGGQGGEGEAGGAATLTAGAGDNGNDDPAYLTVHPGDGIGNPGKAEVRTAGSTGSAGDVLTSDGTYATWAPNTPPVGGVTTALAASQPVNADPYTITWPAPSFDPDGWYSGGSPTNLVVPGGIGGRLFVVSLIVELDYETNTITQLVLNGNVVAQAPNSAFVVCLAAVLELADADVLTARVVGANTKNVGNDAVVTRFSVGLC